MEKQYRLCGRTWAKVIAMILLVLSAFWFVASAFFVGLCEERDIYTISREDALKQAYDNIASKYSVGAVIDNTHQYRYDELKHTNFRYGVIHTDDIENVDIKDRKVYDFECFDEQFDNIKKQDLHQYSCTFDENSCFSYSPTLFGSAYIYNEQSSDVSYVPIQGAFYNWQNRHLYFSDGETLYNYPYDLLIYNRTDKDDESLVFNGLESGLVTELTKKDGKFQWKNPKSNLLMLSQEQYQMDLGDVKIVDSVELDRIGTVSEQDAKLDENGYFEKTDEQKSSGNNYYVISYVADPLVKEATLQESDLFAQADTLMSILYENRYVVAVHLVISLILCIVCIAFLCAAAGRKTGSDELVGHFWDRIPLDVSFWIIVTLDCCLIPLGIMGASMIGDNPIVSYRRVLPWLLIFATGTLSVILTQLWFMMAAFQAKQKQFLRHNVWYILLAWCRKICKKITSVCRDMISHLSAFRYLLAVIAVLGIVELFLITIAAGAGGFALVIWLIQLFVLVFFAYRIGVSLDALSKAGDALANGRLDYHLDTGTMPGVLKRHGDNLSAIGEGMNLAVAERMKSERMKTELITNVSHDIKTPLTSIINYVDLLGKEPMESAKAKEYLEVLSRQSEKLKKLIEDLIEASKASTGNLSVDRQVLDAGVVMTQVVGEFEERLAKSQIELLVKTPEDGIRIWADSRHLWRVFDNLLNNICKYAMTGSRAYVNLEKVSETKAVVIFRNMSGAPLNLNGEELLERFVRADSSRHSEGNGLGLSIAKSLMELMGGNLNLTVDGDLFKVVLEFELAPNVDSER